MQTPFDNLDQMLAEKEQGPLEIPIVGTPPEPTPVKPATLPLKPPPEKPLSHAALRARHALMNESPAKPETPFDYFACAGMLLYNQGTRLLVNRQVLPFADLDGYRLLVPDACYFRMHILMHTSAYSMPGEPVFASAFRNARSLSPKSYFANTYADSVAGFTGRRRTEMRGPAETAFEALGRYAELKKFEKQTLDKVARIYPKFYVAVDMERLQFDNGGTTMDLASRFDLMQMYDVASNQVGWFKELDFGPFVLGQPFGDEDWENDLPVMELALWQYFVFQRIYIGMPGFRHRLVGDMRHLKHQHDGRPLFGAEQLMKPLSVVEVNQSWMEDGSGPLYFAETFYLEQPVMHDADFKVWERQVLNTPAYEKMGWLLGRPRPDQMVVVA